MKGWPHRIAAVSVCVLASRGLAQVGEGEVTVVLVPEHAGPYVPGEHITVDIFLEQSFDEDLRLDRIRFDFSDSDPALTLDSDIVFDLNGYSAGAHDLLTDLPVPWLENTPDCICPLNKMPLSQLGALHIASIGVTMPQLDGVYALDLLNADEPSSTLGALCRVEQEVSPWSGTILRANQGTVLGGSLALVVETPPIPAVSEWGFAILAVLLLVGGTLKLHWRLIAKETGA